MAESDDEQHEERVEEFGWDVEKKPITGRRKKLQKKIKPGSFGEHAMCCAARWGACSPGSHYGSSHGAMHGPRRRRTGLPPTPARRSLCPLPPARSTLLSPSPLR